MWDIPLPAGRLILVVLLSTFRIAVASGVLSLKSGVPMNQAVPYDRTSLVYSDIESKLFSVSQDSPSTISISA